jgi:hypothetical protein
VKERKREREKERKREREKERKREREKERKREREDRRECVRKVHSIIELFLETLTFPSHLLSCYGRNWS